MGGTPFRWGQSMISYLEDPSLARSWTFSGSSCVQSEPPSKSHILVSDDHLDEDEGGKSKPFPSGFCLCLVLNPAFEGMAYANCALIEYILLLIQQSWNHRSYSFPDDIRVAHLVSYQRVLLPPCTVGGELWSIVSVCVLRRVRIP